MTEPVHLSDIERDERKRVDWTRVHIEGDRRPALQFIPRPGRWLLPIRRKP